MPQYLTPLQIFENYKNANPQKCKGKSTTEICKLAGLSDKQIAELKSTSAWLFCYENENTSKNQDFSITEIFGGHFNQTKTKSEPETKFNSYSEGLDRHISVIQVGIEDFYFNPSFPRPQPKIAEVIVPQLKKIGRELGILILPTEKDGAWIEDKVIRLHDNSIYTPNFDCNRGYNVILENSTRCSKGSLSVQGEASKSLLYSKVARTGKSYVEGGNALITNNSNGEPSAIIGEDSLYYTLQALNLEITPKNIEKAKKVIAEELHLDRKNVVYIPQIDFHIDMYYRPLHNGEIAVPDYSSAIEILKNNDFGIDANSKKYLISRLTYTNEKMENILKNAEKELTENNYKIVKVPCFNFPSFEANWDEDTKNFIRINYMNGICGTTANDETFFITNSSGYKKLDSYMKKFFKEIGIDKPYFVSTQSLLYYSGGLDCITQEM